jgi:hypothetical protein
MTDCLRWRERRSSWATRETIDTRRYEVAPVDETPCRRFVEAHHYSGSFCSPRLRYGLYRGEQLVGAAVFSVPMNNAVLANPFPSLVPMWESLELGRFVLLDDVPANGESWFLARCFELARKEGIRGVVSFSDPVPRTNAEGDVVFPGHLGWIYQASNAIRAGRSTPRTVVLLPDGRTLVDRALQKVRSGWESGRDGVEARLVAFGATPRQPLESEKAFVRRALVEVGARRLRHKGNVRYLFTLGSAREKRLIEIGLPRDPYPKSLEAA